MRKLLINGLLALVFVLLLIALFSALMSLRATDQTDAAIDSLGEEQQAALVQEKAVVAQTGVSITVSNGTSNSSKTNTSQTTNTSSQSTNAASSSRTKKTSTTDADVNSFLNS